MGMVEDVIEIAKKQNIELEQNINYKSHEWRTFMKQEIKKWV